MRFNFTHAWWLLAAPVCLAWILWLARTSYVSLSRFRKWTSSMVRLALLVSLLLALAGLQWLSPREGLNVFFILDRSDSVPGAHQEASLRYVRQAVLKKKPADQAGIVVFGAEASIESSIQKILDPQKIHAVVPSERTDLGAAIRLATAAFPENGQKRLVLLSDGNENHGDAVASVLAGKSLGISVDVVPLGAARGGDVAVTRLSLPPRLKKGQTFEVKILAQAGQAAIGAVRLFRNEQYLGEQKVDLTAGKNLFAFPQTLNEPGFYNYDVVLEAAGDPLPQNNRASGFAFVRGDPRVLVISADPQADAPLAAALQSSGLEIKAGPLTAFPPNLAELESFDAVLLSNIAAGDLGKDLLLLLESAVRDFGVGLVCIGGDQAFTAGGYRNTPLENTLPVDMELNSKKVLPSGALVLVVHATEFPNGNQWARDIAFAALDALGPQDEMGIVLWDGSDRWLFPLAKVGDKKQMGQQIAGMRPGDMPNFQKVMEMAHDGLIKSTANLKHMVVFSDGDPGRPSDALVQSIAKDRITISSVMIGGHVAPDTMLWLANTGGGRFYDVSSPGQLPQIFIKEAAVILKAAIFEETFKPRLAGSTEPVRGIPAEAFPPLRGYVATNPKTRAEVPLVSDKGDPILAHWQYGLGRAVAFTSDAKAKWAADWIRWDQYRQFWSQVVRWSLRRVENADFSSEVSIEKGDGSLSVEALDAQGNFRNFLNLQAVVISPKGERALARLEQTGPGRYETHFQTREVGTYLLNLMELQNGELVASQVLGASVNYSPEFDAAEPNINLLQRLAEIGSGQMLKPNDASLNPFLHDRLKTYQPLDLWEWLLKLAVILFPLDVGIRRIYIDWAEWLKATQTLRHGLFFWKKTVKTTRGDESLAALLAKRQQVRESIFPTAGADLLPPRPSAQARIFSPETAAPAAAQSQSQSNQPQTSATSTGSTDKAESAANRLREAKRRAQRWNN